MAATRSEVYSLSLSAKAHKNPIGHLPGLGLTKSESEPWAWAIVWPGRDRACL
jgi:hypothetical protein